MQSDICLHIKHDSSLNHIANLRRLLCVLLVNICSGLIVCDKGSAGRTFDPRIKVDDSDLYLKVSDLFYFLEDYFTHEYERFR